MTATNLDVEMKFVCSLKDGSTSEPTISFKKVDDITQLTGGPLVIGTIDDVGDSFADFIGTDFPDTDGIPVLGSLMNKVSFQIDNLYHEGVNGTKPNRLLVKMSASVSDFKIGESTLKSLSVTAKKGDVSEFESTN